MHLPRPLRRLTLTLAAALALSGCAAVYDPDAAAPPLWVRQPEITQASVAAVGQEKADAAWRFAVDFAFGHQFREELMDPKAPPTTEQLTTPVIAALSPAAQPYWRQQVELAASGDNRARENLDALQFSGWRPDVAVTKPASNRMLLTQAIEKGKVDYDATDSAIKVSFAYTATLQMSARGHIIPFHAENPATYWLVPTPDGSFTIDSYQGALEIYEV